MNQKILNHFKHCDPILFTLIQKLEPLQDREASKDFFIDLCESIISQQLSIKASDTIYKRFQSLFKQNNVNPQETLTISSENMRKAGISFAKIKYIQDLAQKVVNKEIYLEKLKDMKDEEVITELIKVKGIGRWTAEMFLMFSLQRPDIFSHGDLGLKRAIEKIYGFKKEPTTKQIEKIVSKWIPYRTFASRILWKSLELKS